MPNITKLNSPRADETLTKLLKYQGSIQDTPLEEALDENRQILWDVAAIIDCAIGAIERHFSTDWPAAMPEFPRALRLARETLETVSGRLEADQLENRAIALARARGTSTGGAA